MPKPLQVDDSRKLSPAQLAAKRHELIRPVHAAETVEDIPNGLLTDLAKIKDGEQGC